MQVKVIKVKEENVKEVLESLKEILSNELEEIVNEQIEMPESKEVPYSAEEVELLMKVTRKIKLPIEKFDGLISEKNDHLELKIIDNEIVLIQKNLNGMKIKTIDYDSKEDMILLQELGFDIFTNEMKKTCKDFIKRIEKEIPNYKESKFYFREFDVSQSNLKNIMRFYDENENEIGKFINLGDIELMLIKDFLKKPIEINKIDHSTLKFTDYLSIY